MNELLQVTDEDQIISHTKSVLIGTLEGGNSVTGLENLVEPYFLL